MLAASVGVKWNICVTILLIAAQTGVTGRNAEVSGQVAYAT